MWLLSESNKVVNDLRKTKFDMLIMEFHEFHDMFAKLFEHIPIYFAITCHIEAQMAHRYKL